MNKKEWKFASTNDDWDWNSIKALCKKIDSVYNWGLYSKIKDKRHPGDLLDSEIVDNIPESFCILPFSRLQIDPDGRAKPCCKYKTGIAPDRDDLNFLPNKNIDQLWNQEEFVKLREQFMQGQRPEGCKVCWDEEAAGVKSLRQITENGAKKNPRYNLFIKLPSQSPSHLDLKLSNLCNLKCRICNPFLSSQWIKEHKDLNLADANVVKIYTENSREKFFDITNSNEDLLKEWAPTLSDIEFYGGEPLLQQEHERILKIVTENSNPSNLRLFYNSNSTQFNESFFKYWNQCAHITINFSVDDIFERFEYQRKNAIYLDVFKNLKLFKEHAQKHSQKYQFNIYCTVGILNVLYLPEFLKEFEEIQLPFWLNLVHYPDHYNIKNLPDDIKEIVKEKYKSIDYTNLQFNKDSMSVNDIVNFMMFSPSDSEMFQKFFTVTRRHDEYRKESFEKVFPELYEILKNYET